MTVGEERDEDRFKNWQLCCVWKLPFRHHRTIQLTQNCVCFINPCIKLFVLSSALVYTTTRPKVLKRLHLLQCVFAYLQRKPAWVCEKTLCHGLFHTDFYSRLVARSCTMIKCTFENYFQGMQAVPNRLQKASDWSCSSQQFASIFLRWFELAHICIQVFTPQMKQARNLS